MLTTIYGITTVLLVLSGIAFSSRGWANTLSKAALYLAAIANGYLFLKFLGL